MTPLLIILAALAAAIFALSLLRIRVRFEIGPQIQLLFVGLGRSGVLVDFVNQRQDIRLFGFTVRSAPLEGSPRIIGEPPKADSVEPPPKIPKPLGEETPVPWWELLEMLPEFGRALGKYLTGLAKSVKVEQLEADIEAGFDQPDLTGMAFGYYQAALAAAPSVVGRVRYTPVWDRAAFSGSGRVTVAMPLYRFIGGAALFMFRLPLRRLWKLAIA